MERNDLSTSDGLKAEIADCNEKIKIKEKLGERFGSMYLQAYRDALQRVLRDIEKRDWFIADRNLIEGLEG